MSSSVNKVILIGRVGRDPEVRSTNTGSKVANFTLATSEAWNDKASGEKKEKTEWHNVVIWNDNLVGIAEKYLKKGDNVYIEGSLSSRKYKDKDEVERTIVEIVIDRFKGSLTLLGKSNKSSGDESEKPAAPVGKEKMARPALDDSDEIPF